MLILTLTMKSSLVLVYVNILMHCQAITVRDDESIYITPKSYIYSNSDIQDYYKPASRADAQTFQYTPDETNQEPDYPQSQSDINAENDPLTRRQQIARRTPAKKQPVEQYLKEVAPTTKTVYNQRYINYARLNDQPPDRDVKQQTEEVQRTILKPSIQYVLQSDVQQKSRSHPQVQYIIPEPKGAQIGQNEQQSNTALAAYQNALLAHQKVLETERQDETSRSSIYVTHSIPKKPIRKIVKPTAPDENIEQYTRLPQYEFQQKRPVVYERQQQQPPEITYQTKLEYTNRDTDFQASTEIPTYQLDRGHKLQQFQYQQISTEEPSYQEEKLIHQHPQPAGRQILSSRQGKTLRPIKQNQQFQAYPETSYQSSEDLEYNAQSKPEEQASIQYQQPSYVKKGPKYLPEPKELRYQPSTLEETEKYQQVVNIPGHHQQGLLQYEAAIAKLQSEKIKALQQTVRPQTKYQQEQGSQAVRAYTLQYPAESQDASEAETEYVRIGQSNKYRSIANTPAVSYRQSHPNANVRYYRNSGTPSISYAHYQ